MMLFRPEGLLPNKARAREFHEADDDEKLDGITAGEEESPTRAKRVELEIWNERAWHSLLNKLVRLNGYTKTNRSPTI